MRESSFCLFEEAFCCRHCILHYDEIASNPEAVCYRSEPLCVPNRVRMCKSLHHVGCVPWEHYTLDVGIRWTRFYNCELMHGWTDVLAEIYKSRLDLKNIVFGLKCRSYAKHLRHILLCKNCYIYLPNILKYLNQNANLISHDEGELQYEKFEVTNIHVLNLLDKIHYFYARLFAMLCEDTVELYARR